MVSARTRPRVKGNRLRKANRYESTSQDTTTIGAYEYYPDNRRSEKVVTSCGVEETAGDGGNTTVRYYYANQSPDRQGGVAWSIVETRNGSNQATRQWVWGPGGTGILPVSYVDELILMDVNGDPTESNDCDPDDQAGESTADERYFYVQDRQPLTQRRPPRGHGRSATAELCSGRCVKGNWNVVALTGYDPTGEGGGNVVERYSYTPYGEFIVLNTAISELGNVLPTSTVGNPFAHQGLPFDAEKSSYQNRYREYLMPLHRFGARDPAASEGHLYIYLEASPQRFVDTFGLLYTEKGTQKDPRDISDIWDEIEKAGDPGCGVCLRINPRGWGEFTLEPKVTRVDPGCKKTAEELEKGMIILAALAKAKFWLGGFEQKCEKGCECKNKKKWSKMWYSVSIKKVHPRFPGKGRQDGRLKTA